MQPGQMRVHTLVWSENPMGIFSLTTQVLQSAGGKCKTNESFVTGKVSDNSAVFRHQSQNVANSVISLACEEYNRGSYAFVTLTPINNKPFFLLALPNKTISLTRYSLDGWGSSPTVSLLEAISTSTSEAMHLSHRKPRHVCPHICSAQTTTGQHN